jgi:hypothetical protein
MDYISNVSWSAEGISSEEQNYKLIIWLSVILISVVGFFVYFLRKKR